MEIIGIYDILGEYGNSSDQLSCYGVCTVKETEHEVIYDKAR